MEPTSIRPVNQGSKLPGPSHCFVLLVTETSAQSQTASLPVPCLCRPLCSEEDTPSVLVWLTVKPGGLSPLGFSPSPPHILTALSKASWKARWENPSL